MISVIVPIYNVEKYLEECLISIEKQTYQNIEVIMINDGSTDSSESICQRFAKKDKRFRLITQKNAGVCVARNVGMLESKGEYISFVDSDDTIDRDFLEILLKALENHNADMVRCDLRVNGIKEHPNWKTRKFEGQEIFQAYLSGGELGHVVMTKLYKKEIIRDILFPPDRPIMEDAYWTACVLEKCNTVIKVADAKYEYRVRPNSLTHMKLSEYKECGKFRNLIEKATIIERNITDKESLAKLVEMVLDFVPWILGSYNNLKVCDVYTALRKLNDRLILQGADNDLLAIIHRNPDFRKAQNEYLLYEFKANSCGFLYLIKIIYRRFKRRWLSNGRNMENI